MHPIYSRVLFSPMQPELPPTIDPKAALRWASRLLPAGAWLHEEVARRMEERLELMTLRPRSWVHWEPLRSGLLAHGLLNRRYPKAECFMLLEHADHAQAAMKNIANPWWELAHWRGPANRFEEPAAPVQMLWSNMALHMVAAPQTLMQRWHQLLETDGFLMFSCLGPDSLRELRQVYSSLGWAPPSHEFTDMHDWGDMLVQAGFADPVMDVERITLTYSTPDALLKELRGLGRNLHVHRFAGLRTRGWKKQLETALQTQLADAAFGGRLSLSFEVIYGHAFKPAPRMAVQAQSRVTLEDFRAALKMGRNTES